jgi:glycerol-3-phosphate dehydrogenase (NAD(P)+)
VGTEICAALKNVIALCAGVCDGMGCGDNTKALLMTRGLAEMARLGVALGGRKESFTGLAGMGDLIVTCCSMHSRNRRCGILIGQGKPVDEAVKAIGAVVEGYYAAANARALARKAGVEMPIAQAAYEVLYENRDVRTVIVDLMSRSKRSELEESWA